MWRGLALVVVTAGCGRISFDPRFDATATDAIDASAFACPFGFVPITGNFALGTKDFCAMRFEAKAWVDTDGDLAVDPSEVDADGCDDACAVCDDTCLVSWQIGERTAVAVPAGVPWRNATQLHALGMCRELGAGYDLMANREWMTIARDAELVGANWSGGAPGVGRVVEGNTDVTDTVFAVSDPTNSYSDTGNSAADPADTGWEQRRTLELSNGSVIWDVPGNMQEWIDWTLGDPLDGPPSCTDGELPAISCPGLAYDDFNSTTGTYDRTTGVGYLIGGMGDALRRGGQTTDRQFGIAGIYALNMNRFTTQTFPATGFRCVYRF
ncbi:MAG TPA: hypothetical protein VIV11_08015 [Kofleriaceae bacterium]